MVGEELLDDVGDEVGIAAVYCEAGDAIGDVFGGCAVRARHSCDAIGHGVGDGDTEAFKSLAAIKRCLGVKEDVGGLVVVNEFWKRNFTEKTDVGDLQLGREVFKLGALVSVAGDDEFEGWQVFVFEDEGCVNNRQYVFHGS